MIKGSFKCQEDACSKRLSDTPNYDPEEISGQFVCLLQCTRASCEACAVSGRYSVARDETGYYNSCKPLSITPPPALIPIPDNCPKAVREETEAALMLFWCDDAASLNRIRNALELLLDDLKIPRGKNDHVAKKRKRLNLHQRIELLEQKRPKLKEICARMMAVKHLGNAGSHSGDKVNREDVFDGLDILERVLHDMYSIHEGELAKMVRQINKRKGPRTKKDG
jgi:hypothetical protein